MFGSLGRLTNRNKGYTAATRERRTRNPFKIKNKEWWRRGESNPDRKALRHEAYMLSSIRWFAPPRSE